MVENKSKNLIPVAIIIAGLLVAGALIYIDMGKDLREKGQAAVGGQTEIPVITEEQSQELQVSSAVLADFAKCLTEKGAKFYGASWCGWCQKQKELFGEDAQFLPYVECVNEETNELTEECQKAEILGFPTWEFPEKGREMGFKTLEELSQLSGCSL